MKLRREYRAADAAASTTEANTGCGSWMPPTVALLIALMVALIAWSVTYDGEEWVETLEYDDLGTFLVEEPEPVVSLVDQYRFACQANTIIAGSYGACKDHPSCNLSDDEMMIMYIAGKTSVMACKKYEMLSLYIGINEEIETLKNIEPEEWLDDAPVPVPDDEEQARNELRIDF